MTFYAPIVLFTYKREDSLKKTIHYLKKNNLSKHTNLYIYSDGYKSDIEKNYVIKVRRYLKKIRGFKKITLILRKKNYGLSNNIKDGITTVVNKYGKVIVLEDDIVVSKSFLAYMNQALDYYKNKKEVWHVNSWSYNLDFDLDKSNQTYLTKLMNCWGWGTWKDRWSFFHKDPKKIIKNFNSIDISKFNLDNSYDYWSQVKRNYEKKLNTWAIFWYAIIFKNNGLCISPFIGQSKNIGNDSFSEHTPNEDNCFEKIPSLFFKININFFIFSDVLIENNNIRQQIILLFKKDKNKKLILRIFEKFIISFIKILKFNSFKTAKFFSQIFFFSDYQSSKINLFKLQSFENQKNINLIHSPSFQIYYNSIIKYKIIYKNYPNNILDIGGGLGENILELKKNFGIQIKTTVLENKNLVNLIQKRQLKHCNFCSNIDDIRKKKFDIIILSAVLEYLENPYELIIKINNFSPKFIIIGRIDLSIKNCGIQVSKLCKNVPYISDLPKNKNDFFFTPYQKVSIKKITAILKNYKILSKNYNNDKKLNIIFKYNK